ncbi:MAG: BLUF domain-containing protein [Betaproteobacteria bacterium]|nr:BLUF domain-containing protein [Betaproteobacteria bacterium]
MVVHSSADQAVLTIVYVSAATHPMSEEGLAALLKQARENNASHGVTGVLLYHDGNFMQLLQGPADDVRNIYAAIESDPRHHMVTPIVDETGLPREFADWAMACGQIDTRTWETLMVKLSPDGSALSDGSAASVLKSFWKAGA